MVAVATTGARRHGNGPTYHITAGNEGSVFTIESRTGRAVFIYLFIYSMLAKEGIILDRVCLSVQ